MTRQPGLFIHILITREVLHPQPRPQGPSDVNKLFLQHPDTSLQVLYSKPPEKALYHMCQLKRVL